MSLREQFGVDDGLAARIGRELARQGKVTDYAAEEGRNVEDLPVFLRNFLGVNDALNYFTAVRSYRQWSANKREDDERYGIAARDLVRQGDVDLVDFEELYSKYKSTKVIAVYAQIAAVASVGLAIGAIVAKTTGHNWLQAGFAYLAIPAGLGAAGLAGLAKAKDRLRL
ncbi:hypothetical protein COV18_02990 [Candidatus Woesearchaeota archaeon CG10_big_fil_rev_8_21_14_0_10_37_12]|nr:MAG: hypothetical protein COV18_02990 [Candidatus Woesearchaeota archaeon CG10_big_fil_rev_8_21_14_0_10_37_12]